MSFPEFVLSGSVGWGGVNRPEDVRLVKDLLTGNHGYQLTGYNRFQLGADAFQKMAGSKPVTPPPGAGECDPDVIGALLDFQQGFMPVPNPAPGRVDPPGQL